MKVSMTGQEKGLTNWTASMQDYQIIWILAYLMMVIPETALNVISTLLLKGIDFVDLFYKQHLLLRKWWNI